MKKRRTPQDKKKLSYERDRRNTYGERGANSRFAIRASKDSIERSRRHSEKQTLRRSAIARTEDDLVSVEASVRSLPAAKKRFHKSPDSPLGAVVQRKLDRRELQRQRAATKKAAQAACTAD